jgi:hypothetical protein
MKMRAEANGAGLRSDISISSGASRWTKKSKYVSQMKNLVRSRIREVETAGVAEFREARSKFLERKKEDDDKVQKTKTQANKRNEYTPVPGRIFKLNRAGSSFTNDRIKDKKKVFPAYFS